MAQLKSNQIHIFPPLAVCEQIKIIEATLERRAIKVTKWEETAKSRDMLLHVTPLPQA